MKYEVPQFIDIEDKLLGPFSFKQSVYLIGGAGGGFIIFRIISAAVPILPIVIVLTIASLPLAFGLALSFVKINKRPFSVYLESLLKYSMKPKRYIWKKSARKQQTISQKAPMSASATIGQEYIPKIKKSKLKDLAMSLDMDA